MCKEISVIQVNRVVDKKRIITKWRAEEEAGLPDFFGTLYQIRNKMYQMNTKCTK
jgi:hypothetical protein